MTRHGRCQCGGIDDEIVGEVRDALHCNCERCRRTRGHFPGRHDRWRWNTSTFTVRSGSATPIGSRDAVGFAGE